MRRIFNLLTLLMIAVFAVSCVDFDDYLFDNQRKNYYSVGTPIKVKLKLNVAEEGYVGQKSIGKDKKMTQESIIDNIWILQFDGTDKNSRLITESTRKYDLNFDDEYTTIELYATSYKTRVVVLANMVGGIDWSTVETYEDFLKSEKTTHTIEDNFSPNNIRMSGFIDDTLSKRTQISVDMYRSIAKVSVKLKSASNIKLKQVMILNVPQSYSSSDYLLDQAGAYSGDSYKTTSDYVKYVKDISSASSDEEHMFYVPRNMKGTIENNSEKDKTKMAPIGAMSVLVFAEYKGENLVYKFCLGDNMTNDFNVVANNHYKLEIDIQKLGAYVTDSRVLIPKVISYVFAEDDKLSNSYILNPSDNNYFTRYRIPVRRVDQYWGGTKSGYGNNQSKKLTTISDWKVELLWQDAKGIVVNDVSSLTEITFSKSTGIGASDYFEILVPSTAKHGNFVVQLKKKNQSEVLWSWHFWVTDYNPYEPNPYFVAIEGGAEKASVKGGELHKYVGNIFSGLFSSSYALDRNIGQIKGDEQRQGFYYQFGRKDPFSSSVVYDINGNAINSKKENAQVGISSSVLNPNTFFYGSEIWSSDNISSTQYYWHDANTSSNKAKKSIFDPSPYGFMVPPMEIYSDFNKTNTIWQTQIQEVSYRGFASFKALGYLSNINGSLADKEIKGCYWNSNPFSTESSMSFKFDKNVVNDNNDQVSYRASALQVRPVKQP